MEQLNPRCPMCNREIKQLKLFEDKEEFCGIKCEMLSKTGGTKILMERATIKE